MENVVFDGCNLINTTSTGGVGLVGLAAFYSAIDNHAKRFGTYYGTPLGFVDNGEENLNNSLKYQYDSASYHSVSRYAGRQDTGSSHALMVKYIKECAGRHENYLNIGAGAWADFFM